MAKTMKKPTKAQQKQQDERLQVLNDMIIKQNERKGRTEAQIHMDTILVLLWQSFLHHNQASTHAQQHLYDRMFALKHDKRIDALEEFMNQHEPWHKRGQNCPNHSMQDSGVRE